MKISLRAGERVYINGAVLRVDRKVSLELVNDVMFLLEGQVMQASDATTALRQLYFIVQLMLMNPTDVVAAAAHQGPEVVLVGRGIQLRVEIVVGCHEAFEIARLGELLLP